MNKTNNFKTLFLLLCAPSMLYCAADDTSNVIFQSGLLPEITEHNIVLLQEKDFNAALSADQQAKETETYPRVIAFLRENRGNAENPNQVTVWMHRSNKEGRAFQVSGPTGYELSPLLFAIWKRDKMLAHAVARAFPDYVNTTDCFGRSSLECYMTFMQPGAEGLTCLDRNLLDLLKFNFKDPAERIIGITKANTPQLVAALHLRGAQNFDVAAYLTLLDKSYSMPKRATPVVGATIYGFDGDKIAMLHALGEDQATIAAIRMLAGFGITPENASALDAHIAAYAAKAQEIIAEERTYITTEQNVNLTDDTFATGTQTGSSFQIPAEVSSTGVVFVCAHDSDDELWEVGPGMERLDPESDDDLE